MKLGELLVSAGKLSPAEVEETLKGQAIFGGKFGTNLVEMGYLDERELAMFLSRKTGVPHAMPEQLMDIPAHVLKLIPEEMIRKYRVVPIGVNNRKLILAMADPSDFAAIDEISFVTGYIVLPVITPELRLVTALEKHYEIRRELRYIKVEGGGRNRGRLTSASTPDPAKTITSTAAGRMGTQAMEFDLDEADEVIELPLLSELEDLGALESEATAQLGGAATGFLHPEAILPPVSGGASRQSVKDYNLKGVLQGLTEANDRHDIGDLIVNYAEREFNRAALFLLKGGKATGWIAVCDGKELPGFEKLEIDLALPSILKVVAESKTFYIGPMPITPSNTKLLTALGCGTPLNNMLVPLLMAGRVVAILYTEGATLRPDEIVGDLQRLMAKASMALEILILKSKILLT